MDQSIFRITKELSDIQKNPDLSLAVACRDVDVRNVKALIVGPHETPYEFGFFEFSIKFGNAYPSEPPNVQCITTNNGSCRFNPNIYADGKVCLSILGTWRAEAGEQWSSAQGLESILLSVQSLMSSQPYTNEPGFETLKGPDSEKNSQEYTRKIRHETLRVSVIQRLEGYLNMRSDGQPIQPIYQHDSDIGSSDEEDLTFEPFKDLCKRRFLWYYDCYLATIQEGKQHATDNQQFKRAPFESSGNMMPGCYNYSSLEQRLHRIKVALDKEAEQWAIDGLEEQRKETTVSVNLQYQFDHINDLLKTSNDSYSIALENKNPFVWLISYFGPALEGDVIAIKMTFSPRFPTEQPRVQFENKIFHQRVSSQGVPCYIPNSMKVEDAKSHVDAIVGILEETAPTYDPRKIVNPEATKLYWGSGTDGRRAYNRRLRRSIQDSMQ